MVRFTPIKHIPTYMEIVEQISRMIRNKELLPGAKLPSERTLSADLGIGRQCLREALSVLQVIGLVEVKKGRGTYIREEIVERIDVSTLDIEEVGDPFALMEARRAFETRTAALAAKMAQPRDLEELDQIIVAMAESTKQGVHASELDKKLHLVVARASRNPVFYKFMNIIIANMGKLLWLTLKERSLSVPNRIERYFEEHVRLVEAIKQGDARLAEKIMLQHLSGIEEDLRH